MPAHAAYFSVYEMARNKFGINDEEMHPYLFALTGAIATLFHDMIVTPIDGKMLLPAMVGDLYFENIYI